MNNIILDLDGTIIDISTKYNNVYLALHDKYQLVKVDYWPLRRSFVSLNETLSFLGLNPTRFEEFRLDWKTLIETEDFLKYDFIRHHELMWFERVKNHRNLILCTARQNETLLLGQLRSLGLIEYFDAVLTAKSGFVKSAVIEDHFKINSLEISANDWIIGDTVLDIQTGRNLGIRTCGVLTGLSRRADFESIEADQICESLSEFDLI
jgi:phosphoglycolate phosphatase